MEYIYVPLSGIVPDLSAGAWPLQQLKLKKQPSRERICLDGGFQSHQLLFRDGAHSKRIIYLFFITLSNIYVQL